jgi:ubiquinol-cytochrome c reductase cytochrome c subunit
MKHLSTLLVVTAGVLAIGALAIPRDVGAQAAGDAARGKIAFMKNGCYECHGTQGQGNLSAGPPLTPHPIPYANFITYIRAPKQDMPPYSARILPENVAQDIHAYLMSIPAGPRPDAIALLKGIGTGPALPPAIAHGHAIFVESCQKCHGSAPIGPGLGNIKARLSLEKTVDFIKNPAPPMPRLYPGTLSEGDVSGVAAYVQTL